jgi:hypothetical protein
VAAASSTLKSSTVDPPGTADGPQARVAEDGQHDRDPPVNGRSAGQSAGQAQLGKTALTCFFTEDSNSVRRAAMPASHFPKPSPANVELARGQPRRRRLAPSCAPGYQRLDHHRVDHRSAGDLAPRRRQVVHGASCHVCLFVSETTYERGNRFLDRFIVPTGDEGLAMVPDL